MLMTFWIYFKILAIAKAKNLVDNPDARKLQKRPVPVMGGIAVFFGVLCGTLLATCIWECDSILPIVIAMSMMLYIGAIDDIIDLTPRNRIIIEVLAILGIIYGEGACIDSLHGLWGIETFSWWIGVPLTVFAGVGIINAMNMIDGVNGLSSGLCITFSCMFGIAMIKAHDYPNAMLAFIYAGALLPFLIHNVLGKTSKMFIGDAGTMTMGILMTWYVIQMLRYDHNSQWIKYVSSQHLSLVALTLAILAVPVGDTLRVMFRRIMKGQSPFKADKTHLHHMLLSYSGSHSLTSLIEISIAIIIVIVWAIAFKSHCSINAQFYVVLITAASLVWGSYAYLSHQDKRNSQSAYRIRRSLTKMRQGEKDWWNKLQRFIDTPFGPKRDAAHPDYDPDK
jgi:UDP-N-acetylmuramyl pentapeptide phosphotransferase/UDP-N-acetylglucosamine-1-phosphate transferase